MLLVIDIILYSKVLKMLPYFDKTAYCKVLKCLWWCEKECIDALYSLHIVKSNYRRNVKQIVRWISVPNISIQNETIEKVTRLNSGLMMKSISQKILTSSINNANIRLLQFAMYPLSHYHEQSHFHTIPELMWINQ